MSFAIQATFSLLSGLLGSKIRERIVVVGSSLKELLDDIEPIELPAQLGGSLAWDWGESVKRVDDQCVPEIQDLRLGDAVPESGDSCGEERPVVHL